MPPSSIEVVMVTNQQAAYYDSIFLTLVKLVVYWEREEIILVGPGSIKPLDPEKDPPHGTCPCLISVAKHHNVRFPDRDPDYTAGISMGVIDWAANDIPEEVKEAVMNALGWYGVEVPGLDC